MRIKIAFFVVLSVFFSNFSFSDKISSINIVGNERISDETIILFSKISKNEEINDEEQLNQIFKNIQSTNFFSEIEVSFSDNILLIKVVENPIINEVEFSGIKSNKLQEQIYKNLSLKNKSSFVEGLASKDLTNIKNVLKNSGYYFSDVQLSIKEKSNNSINLIYNIKLGEKALITL